MTEPDALPELDPAELDLLAALRAEDAPHPAARARVLGRVLQSTATPSPAPATGRLVRGPWVIAAAAAVAAAALLAINLGGEEATPSEHGGLQQAADTPEVPSNEGLAQPVRRPAEVERTVVGADERSTGPVVVPSLAPDLPPTPAPKAQVRPSRAQAPSTHESTPASSLAEETRMLDRARKALAAGQPQQALWVLRDASTRFPAGVLGQEREALIVVALCDAGKVDEGRAAASVFLRAHPRSALRARVEGACPPND